MRKLIRADGTEQLLPRPVSMAEIEQMIGATVLDTVALHHLGWPLHVMVVDDRGYETQTVEHGPGHFERKAVKALKPVNEKATALYLANCRPGVEHKIVGDVVVVPDDDYAVPDDDAGEH